jgi:hypothetical protein
MKKETGNIGYELEDKQSVKDYVEYCRDYEVLNQLSKDELIKRYISRMGNMTALAFLGGILGGMLLMGVIAFVAINL